MNKIIKFQQKVYSLTKKIPQGKVSTYKEIGRKIGKRGQIYRAVGVALKKNRDKKVPCHRVINSSGFVGQFNKGIKQKIKLLRKEGIIIENNKINLKKYFFKTKTKK